MSLCVPTLMLVLLASVCSDPEPIPGRLTLTEAIRIAQTGSPRLRALASTVDAAQAGVRLSRAARLPDVEVSARYQRIKSLPELALVQPDGSRMVVFPDVPNRYGARLGVQVPVYTGGRLEHARDAADRQHEAATHNLQAALADLRLEVTSAYLQAQLAAEQERVLRQGMTVFDAHLKDVRSLQRFGMAAYNELLAVQVEHDRAELALLEAESAQAIALAELARLLGMPPQALETVQEPTTAPESIPELEALVTTALHSRPERAAAAARMAAARVAAEVERADLKPLVAASAGIDYARPNQLVIPLRDDFDTTWDVGISLSYRFADGGKRRAAVSRAEAKAEAARHALEELDRAIRLQVTALRQGLTTAQASVPVAGSARASAFESLRVAGERFREGLIPSSELLDAEVALLRAGLDHTAALLRQRLARAQLEHAVHEPW